MVTATLSSNQKNALSDLDTIHKNEKLAPRHRDEWRESAVSEEIITLNVKTIFDPREIDKILGRNTKRRWKHSDELAPAWCASGIDPLTDEATLQGVQVKPDTAPINKDGKPQKYLGATGMETAPLFLRTGIEGYWLSIIQDILKPIIITEGAKKAGAGLSAGYATISIPGVSTCRKNGRLHQLLEVFAVLGRTFYLCFDNDILYKKPVRDGLTGLAAQLARNGSNVMVIKLPDGDAKGMDDYISMHGTDAFQELVENAATFKEWKDEIDELQLDEDDKPRSKIARYYEIINEAWGESLRYNSLKKDIEFNGAPLNAEYLKLLIGLQFPMDISKDDAFTIVEFIAKRNTYSPVVEYLDEVEAKYPDIDTSFLDDLAKHFFGTDDPLHAKYFKNFLVASVARARYPGCWMDCALLLVGAQGIRKSTFWRTLYGDDFFSDDLGDGSDKDERMKMHRFWCLEWSEFETVYKRKDIAQLKAFLARRHETFRTPYDRLPKDYKRSCVFAGTTNEKEILNDPTGNRRFWIIPVTGIIPVEEVQKLRDRIWAAANALLKAGYSYKLTDDEEVTREEQNEEYEVTHPWSDIISRFISCRDYFTVQEIYKELGIDPVHQNPVNQRQITTILKKLECEPDRVKVAGKWVRIWREKKSLNFKNDFSAGSAGSGGSASPEIQVQQEPQLAPGENQPLDLSDMIPTQNLIPDIAFDPAEDRNNEITVSQADSNTSSHFDPADPVDPAENLLEQHLVDSSVEANSTEPVQPQETAPNDKFACPPPDEYYRDFPAKPFKFTIDTHYGDCEVTARPFKKIKSTGDSEIHLLYEMDMGRTCAKIKCKPDRQVVQRLAKESKGLKQLEEAIVKHWYKRAEKEVYRVKNADDVWIENCKLTVVPKHLQHFFIFETPTGEKVHCTAGRFETYQVPVQVPDLKIGDRVTVKMLSGVPDNLSYLVCNKGTIVAIDGAEAKISFEPTQHYDSHCQHLNMKHLEKV